MGLVTNITKRIELPGVPDGYAVIRKLSWKQLDRASEVQRSRSATQMREMGCELMKAFLEAKSSQDAVDKVKAVQDAQEKAATTYDRETVFGFGLASWSLSEKPSEAIDDLEQHLAKYLHEAIVEYALEAAPKNA